MIIDFHTHLFPDTLAPRAVGTLARSGDMMNYSDGTLSGLRRSMDRSGVDLSLVAPVVTRPEQTESINRFAYELNRHTGETGVLSLGGVHPEDPNWRQVLTGLKERGFSGIKLHPLFQGTAIDDIRYLRIIGLAAELDLAVLIHAGLDPTYPGVELASPKQLARMMDAVPYRKLVLAHLGALGQWSEAEMIFGRDVYIDTACALYPWRDREGKVTDCPGYVGLTPEEFTSIVRHHGADRVLFGSDSPWTDQGESLSLIRSSGLTDGELDAVFGGNAARLLGSGRSEPGEC